MLRQFSRKDVWILQKDTWKVPPKILPKVFLLAAILRQQQVETFIKKSNNHNITMLYTNIFIEVYWLKFLSNTQPPSTSETHSMISHAIYYSKACPLLYCQLFFHCLPQIFTQTSDSIHWNSSKGSPLFRCRHCKIFVFVVKHPPVFIYNLKDSFCRSVTDFACLWKMLVLLRKWNAIRKKYTLLEM